MFKLKKLFILLLAVLLCPFAYANTGSLPQQDSITLAEQKEDVVVTRDYTIYNGVDIKSNHVATIDEDFICVVNRCDPFR
jgi:hypothetical protein